MNVGGRATLVAGGGAEEGEPDDSRLAEGGRRGEQGGEERRVARMASRSSLGRGAASSAAWECIAIALVCRKGWGVSRERSLSGS